VRSQSSLMMPSSPNITAKHSHKSQRRLCITYLRSYPSERLQNKYACERYIRDWVDTHLITKQGVRGQILRGEGHSQELDNQAIDQLIAAHLLRREERRGANWIELAHDRLVEPVRADNAKYHATLNHLQRQAEEWQKTHSDWLLLRGGALKEAEDWADQHPGELAPSDRDFLAACQKAHRRAWWVDVLTISSLVLLLTTLGAAVWIGYLNRQLKVNEERLERSNEQLSSPERAKQVNSAQRAYEIIASATPEHRRVDVIVQYYYKDREPEEVFDSIQRLGFRLEKRQGRINTPTNFVRYTPSVSIDDVRQVCVTLISSNVPLTSVDCFKNPEKESIKNKKVIQIGAGVSNQGNPLWTVERLNDELSPCPVGQADAGDDEEDP